MRNRKGFTLLEVVVGMAIVAIVSVPLLQMFVTSTRVGRHSYDTDKANAVVLQTVEQIKSGIYPVTLDGSGQFTQASYFTYDWGTGSAANYAFRMDITVTGSVSNAMQSSYIPQFVNSSGTAYAISITYGPLPSSNYTLTLTDTGGAYQLTCNAAILNCNGVTGATTISVPKADLASSVFPVAVDNTQNTLNTVQFAVSSNAGVQLGLYVFGDSGNLVSMALAGGGASITKLSSDVNSMKFDKLTIHATVTRADGSVIADYQTLGYNVATASGVM